MAKAPKVKLNIGLLTAIGNGSVTMISKDDATPLIGNDPPLIEVNTAADVIVDGKAPVRLTAAGVQMVTSASQPVVGGPASGANGTAKFAIISNAVLPASKRGNKGGGAPTVYPFDTMEIGNSFFVPVSEKHPDPVKTLGSTVSSANMRFAEKTGEMKTVTRNKRGPKNKLVMVDGKPVPETVQVPVYKHTRKFSIRPVKSGVAYGDWVAPADGALIARVELKSAE